MQIAFESKKSSLFVTSHKVQTSSTIQSQSSKIFRAPLSQKPVGFKHVGGLTISKKDIDNQFSVSNMPSVRPILGTPQKSKVANKIMPQVEKSNQSKVGFNQASFMNNVMMHMSQKQVKSQESNKSKILRDRKALVSEINEFKIDGETELKHKSSFMDNDFMKQAQDIVNQSKDTFGSKIQSRRAYPSVLMQAVENVTLELPQETEIADSQLENSVENSDQKSAPPRRRINGLKKNRLVELQKKQNKRYSRESKMVPKLEPFGKDKFWDFKTFPRIQKNWSKMNAKDKFVAKLIGSIHAVGILGAPFFFTKGALALGFLGYMITSLGITISYHRQLTHKSFETPKWLEYFFATWGVLAIQGHPMDWVSSHRHHHQNCDDIADPHSPYDGFFWSHMGWLFDSKSQMILFDTSNIKDMQDDPYYNFLKDNYLKITLAQPALYFLLGGMPGLVYGFALRTVFTWHVTWAVNSICHVYGRQMWKTGDISMNNPFIGILAQGEGWHNNHHAFQESCRHGLKWWQFDLTWYIILALEKAGLASKLKYPSKKKMEKLSWANYDLANSTGGN